MLSIRRTNKIIRKLTHTDTSQTAKKNLRKVNRSSVEKKQQQQVKCERHWNGTDCRFFICDFKLL